MKQLLSNTCEDAETNKPFALMGFEGKGRISVANRSLFNTHGK
jgi:hypothetical protein